MEWTIGKDRLTFKKTFSTKEILFTDIVEITVGKNLFRLTTRDGKEIKEKIGFGKAFHLKPELFDAIRKNNIAFRDEDALEDTTKIVSSEELEKEVEKAEAIVSPYANKVIKDRLGEAYGIGLTTLFDDQFVSMYFSLLKDGAPVTDIPEEAVFSPSPLVPGSFDLLTVGILCKWDATRNSGRYDPTIEMLDRTACEKYITKAINEFCDDYTGTTPA